MPPNAADTSGICRRYSRWWWRARAELPDTSPRKTVLLRAPTLHCTSQGKSCRSSVRHCTLQVTQQTAPLGATKFNKSFDQLSFSRNKNGWVGDYGACTSLVKRPTNLMIAVTQHNFARRRVLANRNFVIFRFKRNSPVILGASKEI